MAHPEPAGHEEEEHHGSPWPVIIAVGMGVAYVGIVTAGIPMLLAGDVIFAGGAGGWIHQDKPHPSSAVYGPAASGQNRFPRARARRPGLRFGEGLTFKSAPFGVNPLYGPTFYAQTGVHGSHVTAGVLAMAYTTRKAFKGGFTKENHEAVELVGLYWHFVDVVWIFLFTIVYLI